MNATDAGAAVPEAYRRGSDTEVTFDTQSRPVVELNIDRAVYLVDDDTKTYRYLRRNPDWRELDAVDNERNKRRLDGYTRVFPDGRSVSFQYRAPYTTPPRGRARTRSPQPAGGESDLARLRRTVKSFAGTVLTALPSRQPRPGTWSVQEVLAHIVYWHEHYVSVIRARLAGAVPWLPDATFAALNAAAVQRMRTQPVATLVKRLTDAQAELERLAADARVTVIDVRVKSGSKPWPWPEFLRRVEAHIRGHESNLRRSMH